MSKSFQDFIDSLDLQSPNIQALLTEPALEKIPDLDQRVIFLSALVSAELLRQYHRWNETPDE